MLRKYRNFKIYCLVNRINAFTLCLYREDVIIYKLINIITLTTNTMQGMFKHLANVTWNIVCYIKNSATTIGINYLVTLGSRTTMLNIKGALYILLRTELAWILIERYKFKLKIWVTLEDLDSAFNHVKLQLLTLDGVNIRT